jgi:hypothetical protein
MHRLVWLVAAVIACGCLTVGTAFAQEGNEFQLPPVKLRPERPTTAKPIPPTPDERPAPAEKAPEAEKPAEPPAPPAEKPAETPKKTPPVEEKPPAPPVEPLPPPPPPVIEKPAEKPVEKPVETPVETPKKTPPVAEKPVKAPKETPAAVAKPAETPKRPRTPKAPLVVETPKQPVPTPAAVPVEPALPPLPPMPAELAQPSPAAPAAPVTPVAPPAPPVTPILTPAPAAPVTPVAVPAPVEPAPVAAPVREMRPEEIQKQVAETQAGPVTETDLAGMGELGLVEEVTRTRRAYARALAALQQYYTNRGMAYKLDWVRTELDAFEKVPKVQYLGVAEIAGPNLRPSRSVAAADQIFAEAMHFKNYPAFPPAKKDYLKLALDKFQALITQFPDSDKIADAAFMMGDIYGGWYFEDWARAVQCYERCWQWDPKTPRPALFNAAKIYEEKLKNRAKAVELYNRVLNESNDQNLVNQSRDRIRALTGR